LEETGLSLIQQDGIGARAHLSGLFPKLIDILGNGYYFCYLFFHLFFKYFKLAMSVCSVLFEVLEHFLEILLVDT
jgi:hypothetical protein